MQKMAALQGVLMARSERFELPTLGIEIRCSIQLSYERKGCPNSRLVWKLPPGRRRGTGRDAAMSAAVSQAVREQTDHEQPEHEERRQQRIVADGVTGYAEIVVGEIGEPERGRRCNGQGDQERCDM